jgi:hypothetical protein
MLSLQSACIVSSVTPSSRKSQDMLIRLTRSIIVIIFLLILLVIVLYIITTSSHSIKRPVVLPPGWPIPALVPPPQAYQVPDSKVDIHAGITELSSASPHRLFRDGSNGSQYWAVGFRCPLGFKQSVSYVDGVLKSKGFMQEPAYDPAMCVDCWMGEKSYFSTDLRTEVTLTYLEWIEERYLGPFIIPLGHRNGYMYVITIYDKPFKSHLPIAPIP